MMNLAAGATPFRGHEALCRTFPSLIVALLVLTWLSSLPSSQSQLIADTNSTVAEIPVAQLWYDGLWKSIPSFNGSVVKYGRGNVTGKIAYWVHSIPPHESRIEAAQRDGAIAALFFRVSRNEKYPGATMFQVDGSDRRRLKIPVFEALVRSTTHPFFSLHDGVAVKMTTMPNRFVIPAREPFQLAANLVQSFLEMAIVVIGLFRLRQFLRFTGAQFHFLSIGPICIFLEMIGALLRLAYTCVDPFYTYRMIPDQISVVLVTVSFPFTLTAGILLAFFWAESLSTSSIETKDFVSRYKIPAFIVIVVLFAVEIICGALRATVQGKVPVSPNYISVGFYLIVALVLIIAYITVTILVINRLRKMRNPRSKHAIRVMTLRVAASTSGYALFAIGFILYSTIAGRPWGVTISLNLAFLGENIAGLLQVIAIRPISASKKGSKGSKGLKNEMLAFATNPESAAGLDTVDQPSPGENLIHDTNTVDSDAHSSDSDSARANGRYPVIVSPSGDDGDSSPA